jgi:hypothetical protein
MTAYPEALDARVLGVTHVIPKPFHIRDLLAVLTKFGANQSGQKELHW